MKTFSRWQPIAASLGLSLLAAGCGGGGGDAGGSPLTLPTTPVAISASNQDAVSRAAAVGAQGGFASATVALSADGRAHAMGAGAAGVRSRPLAAVFAPLALHALRAPTAGGRARIAAVVDTGALDCSVSGTSRIVLDDRDGNGAASAGEAVTVTFANCEDVAGEKINGSLALTVSELTRATLLSFSATATMSSLSISATGRSVVYDGDMSIRYAETSATASTVDVVIGNRLGAIIQTPSYSDTIALLSGYRITTDTDDAAVPPNGGVTGRSTTTASGQVASTQAGGAVSVRTTVPVVEYDADGFPSSGQLVVSGSSGSVTLTALAGGQVRIDRDDGSTKTVAWSFLF